MLISKDEAENKWCPYASGTRPDEACIASDCSAWRWWDRDGIGGARRGYCGLAGVPDIDDSLDRIAAAVRESAAR